MEDSLEAFQYTLPPELVAQEPLPARDDSRLLVLRRLTGHMSHTGFRDLPQWLGAGDVLVVNDTRVFPARLIGHKETGGRIELLLTVPPTGWDSGKVHEARAKAWWRASKRPRPGQVVNCGSGLEVEIIAVEETGMVDLRLWSTGDLGSALAAAGEMPLPPYIRRQAREQDRERYQTIFADQAGAVAAPTAGLHFTPALREKLQAQGVEVVSLTLHVGPGTFQPVRTDNYREHRLAPEYFRLSSEAATRLNAAKSRGKKIVAVGTTTVRVLESQAAGGVLTAGEGWCDLFILPGHRFQMVDTLITNFHLPKSTLLLLVSAFAGRQTILAAYREAVARRYRFYSYGDAMLII